jgi:hypothetical protein
MMHRPVVLLTLLAVLGFVLTVSWQAEAKPSVGNNKHNVKACKGTGYLSLYRQDGTGFTNAGECTSYAAKGGVLATATPGPTPTRNVIVFISAISSCNSSGEGGRAFFVNSSGFAPSEQLRYVFTGVVSYEILKTADATGFVDTFAIDGITNEASGTLTVTVYAVPSGEQLGTKSITITPYSCSGV